jgi:hypothetical protein
VAVGGEPPGGGVPWAARLQGGEEAGLAGAAAAVEIPDGLFLSPGGVFDDRVAKAGVDVAEAPTMIVIDLYAVLDWGAEQSAEALRAKLHRELVAWADAAVAEGRLHGATVFVAVTPAAVHTFGRPYHSLARARVYRDAALAALGGSRWRVLDALQPTLARPDFKGEYALQYSNRTCGIAYALANVLMNMVCN